MATCFATDLWITCFCLFCLSMGYSGCSASGEMRRLNKTATDKPSKSRKSKNKRQGEVPAICQFEWFLHIIDCDASRALYGFNVREVLASPEVSHCWTATNFNHVAIFCGHHSSPRGTLSEVGLREIICKQVQAISALRRCTHSKFAECWRVFVCMTVTWIWNLDSSGSPCRASASASAAAE